MKLGAATDALRGIGIGLLMAYAGEEETKNNTPRERVMKRLRRPGLGTELVKYSSSRRRLWKLCGNRSRGDQHMVKHGVRYLPSISMSNAISDKLPQA
jgi:hypothetical protein